MKDEIFILLGIGILLFLIMGGKPPEPKIIYFDAYFVTIRLEFPIGKTILTNSYGTFTYEESIVPGTGYLCIKDAGGLLASLVTSGLIDLLERTKPCVKYVNNKVIFPFVPKFG